MKKKLSIFITLLMTGSLLLSACGIEDMVSQEPEPLETLKTSDVQISFTTDDLLSSFNNTFDLDYSDVQGTTTESGSDIVLWSNAPMRDFSILKVEYFDINNDSSFSIVETWVVASEVLPGEAVILSGYFGTGMFPSSGFRFVDENWVTHYFTFTENMGYPNEPGPYRWLIWEFNGITGEKGSLLVS